ncbi:TetR/AcrR family transcriptional regulator [Frankia sp. AgB1.9]|uniref:TetR/AcrR family transcriptional regulator n=1 Tax=unclassified Frankia TaxID=2632575 RepID=UPI0019322CC3|nr:MULTISPECIES: TetR/AcrR family transcriptional regulator [unclassified Frankia]MBL7486892.1 TetR/AcrR family transcriptional regulator [Frankia sp. AgW1.1]MBL7547221.1 TetR/AcrR family transcriptional regulator [Frankia sp. AgB1.9]MBL7623987.1 TetR/AcrR family transcriptional regulator [Frankia sp. AgB1.8]
MTRRGWGGSPPASDAEARRKIVEATIRRLDRVGPARTHLTDIATDLGVTRQTVYRYYQGTDELFAAVTEQEVDTMLAQATVMITTFRDPTELVIELMAYVIEELPKAPHLTPLLVTGRSERFQRGAVAPEVLARGVAMLRDRSPIDWAAWGYDDRALLELMEVINRVIQTMIVAPPQPEREGAELRAFLRRWFGPAVAPRHGDGA